MKKNVLIILICVLILVVLLQTALAQEDIQVDISRRPEKILVAQVETENMFLASDTESWIRLLHYYSVTRLGFGDIPFNYIVDRQGNVYEGMDTSKGLVPYIDSDEGIVLVGYFSQTSDINMSVQNALGGLIEEYSYKYGIPSSKVQAVQLSLLPGDENVGSLFSYQPAENTFGKNFAEAVENLKYSSESNLVFTGSVSNLNYSKSLNVGEDLKVKMVLKNEDEFAWYLDEGLVFLKTVDNVESPFAINQVWEGFTTPFAVQSQLVLVGGEIQLEFDLSAKFVLPGQYKESFEFVMLPDKVVNGTRFDVEFEVLKGEAQIVEIQRTNTGALTVYDCPEFTCTLIASAQSGQRYIVLEERDSWYKIYVEGVEGWITVHYAKKVE